MKHVAKMGKSVFHVLHKQLELYKNHVCRNFSPLKQNSANPHVYLIRLTHYNLVCKTNIHRGEAAGDS